MSKRATTSATNDEAPQVKISGDNPATVQVGVSYQDLDATITAPQADLNLGITTLLDGATTTQVAIDTSVPGTHTIEYTVTDQSGLTGSAQRTVIVANDNTATSTATSTAIN
jgi:hypothetical protein